MCANVDGNKVQVCTVGDLTSGSTYRTPEGGDMLVTDRRGAGKVVVVNTATGLTSEVDESIRLGTDRAGRLYASRFLNPPTPDVLV